MLHRARLGEPGPTSRPHRPALAPPLDAQRTPASVSPCAPPGTVRPGAGKQRRPRNRPQARRRTRPIPPDHRRRAHRRQEPRPAPPRAPLGRPGAPEPTTPLTARLRPRQAPGTLTHAPPRGHVSPSHATSAPPRPPRRPAARQGTHATTACFQRLNVRTYVPIRGEGGRG